MDQSISAADANPGFSKLLRDVQGGASYTVTAHGRPVARIVPFSASDQAMAAAREKLRRRTASQPVTEIGPWTRDELYDR